MNHTEINNLQLRCCSPLKNSLHLHDLKSHQFLPLEAKRAKGESSSALHLNNHPLTPFLIIADRRNKGGISQCFCLRELATQSAGETGLSVHTEGKKHASPDAAYRNVQNSWVTFWENRNQDGLEETLWPMWS